MLHIRKTFCSHEVLLGGVELKLISSSFPSMKLAETMRMTLFKACYLTICLHEYIATTCKIKVKDSHDLF